MDMRQNNFRQSDGFIQNVSESDNKTYYTRTKRWKVLRLCTVYYVYADIAVYYYNTMLNLKKRKL